VSAHQTIFTDEQCRVVRGMSY